MPRGAGPGTVAKLRLILGLIAVLAAPARAEGPAVSGPAEVVYRWAEERCATWDVPDTPARAWRVADGSVRLVAGSEASRAEVGAGLDSLRHDCAVLYRGGGADDPGAYDDRAWVHATYTFDGVRVMALAHVEYHGETRPGRCAAGTALACWRNAIVELRSEDGGRSFARTGLVAGLPYRYSSRDGRRAGYFNPSNVVRRGDWLYAFVWAEAFGAQRRGACLMRRPVAGGAADWRAWDGARFGVRFADPYREDVAAPERHICAPVGGIGSTVSSVVRRGEQFLAVTPATRRGRPGWSEAESGG